MATDRSDLESDPTVAAPAGAPARASTAPTEGGAALRDSRPTIAGYELGSRIGIGGMGEVVLARDPRIGRDIAVKCLRAAGNPEAESRFLREARIQARLDHPAIVPVHEIGHSAEGTPYFTMKRIAGTTFAEVLRSSPEAGQRLLNTFVDVCRAVDFAHSRGVVHRDLKPANIILGEFGEVYVLDWGLARVVGEREAGASQSDIDSLDGMTQAGATLGTPGYMAPEQIRDATTVGTAADIYSLGAILFHILAGEPLHAGPNALAATVAGVDGSPAKRKPAAAIPPELDAVAIDALALDATQRPTARALADRVQRYLDGDRDVARRKSLAAEHVTAARAALVGVDEHGERRVEAMRHAGSALALDPESRDATELFTRLMLEPPKLLPAKLRDELAASEGATQRRQSRAAVYPFIAFAAFLAAVLSGVRSWPTWIALSVLVVGLAITALRFSRHSPGRPAMMVVVFANALLAALMSRAFGSLILVPSVTCVMALSYTSYPQLIDRGRVVIAILVASWILPVVLERADAIATTWRVGNDAIVSTSALTVIGGSTSGIVIGANVIAIIVIGFFANALARSRRDAQRAVEIQAWHLKQLVPVEDRA